MTEMTTPSGATRASYGPVKTLAVRLSESTRAQLDVISQLNNRPVSEEIRLAIESWIEKVKSDPKIRNRAQHVRDEIEREAVTRRDAIAAIFDAGETSGRSSRAKNSAT